MAKGELLKANATIWSKSQCQKMNATTFSDGKVHHANATTWFDNYPMEAPQTKHLPQHGAKASEATGFGLTMEFGKEIF